MNGFIEKIDGDWTLETLDANNVVTIDTATTSLTGNAIIDGDLTVTGNAYLSGNIVGDRIQNGNTIIDIQSLGGNANVSVNGVNNVAVFYPEGLSLPGNVTASYFFGNGSGLTGLTPTVDANTLVGNTLSSNVLYSSLTSFGTLTELNVAGNVSVAGNVTTSALVIPGSGGNITGANNISATGNITGAYFFGDGSYLTGITTSSSAISNGTSNISIATANGNVTVSVDSTGNVAVFSSSGLNITGNLSVTGNVIGDYFVGNGTALTGVMADRGGDPNNWNTLTQMGVYQVNRTDWSGTTGTPLDSQVYKGLLEVKNSTNVSLEQSFYPATVTAGNVKTQWNRTYWGGTWSAWYYVVNDDQVVVGGDF